MHECMYYTHTTKMETLIFMIQLKSFIINLVSSTVHFHQERKNVVDFVQTTLQTVISKYPSSQEPHNSDTIVTFVCPIVELKCYNYTLLFYQIEPYKKGPFLVLPSSIARNSSTPNAKIIFQIHRGILEGCTNRARPSRPSLKNCQNGTF